MVVAASLAAVKRLSQKRFDSVSSWLVDCVSEPRSRRGRQVELSGILRLLWTGMAVGDSTLRDVEQRSEGFGLMDRRGRPVERISDTGLGDLLAALDPEDFVVPLVRQVRTMMRRKELQPEGLPGGVLVIDGKHLATLNHDAKGYGMMSVNKKTERAYWCVRVLRAVVSSAKGKPCVGQMSILGREGEITSLPAFVTWLHETYGGSDLFEIIDLDAGFLSRKVFRFVDELGYGVVVGLKGNQPSLHEEAKRVLVPLSESVAPEAKTPWEAFQGKMIRRKLYRTFEMDGFLEWDRLRQVWLVVQETAHPPKFADRLSPGARTPPSDWTVEREERFFVTNLPSRRLTPAQILLLVRNHWAVENDCFHSLDTRWHEDRHAWCGRGNAILVLGMLRMLAYNLAQSLRKRRLRRTRPTIGDTVPWSWRRVFRWLDSVLSRAGPRWAYSDASP